MSRLNALCCRLTSVGADERAIELAAGAIVGPLAAQLEAFL
jgi:hypothetical protein